MAMTFYDVHDDFKIGKTTYWRGERIAQENLPADLLALALEAGWIAIEGEPPAKASGAPVEIVPAPTATAL
jgi:hypothetical protein